ncbi:MAG TPA: hypothetical protein VFS43_26305 [Polyangiaceae bacterium]|nr:hypothetical protein [Polyangiaceae bacterium]
MKPRLPLRLLSLAASASLLVAGADCAEQAEPDCTVPASGTFPTRLVVVDNPQNCPVQAGIVISTRPYYVLDGDGDVDYDQPFRVAIQTEEMGAAYQRVEESPGRLPPGVTAESLLNGPLYAFGQLSAPRPDDRNYCYIQTMAPANLNVPAIAGVPDDPATEANEAQDPEPPLSLSAEWSDLTFLVTTAYPGVQFTGTLKYTKNGCTITYQATGVFANNQASCATNDEQAPFYRAEGYNPALCSPEPDFSQGIAVGSGINPDFPIECDPVSRLCLLQGSFPAYK